MRLAIAATTLVVAISTALATGMVTDRVRDTLSQIDAIPTQNQLVTVLANPGQDLSSIARDTTVDVGVRLRAIHGLGKFCVAPCAVGDVAHDALTTLITETSTENSGSDVLLLRAAIETLGTLKVRDDVALLTGDMSHPSLLDHPSRDIRAATARALRDLCNNQAVVPLRVRYTAEPTEQVKLAISEALRILQQCGQ